MEASLSSKTHRLYLHLREQIMSGALAADERLPGEPQLAEAHGLSRVTVRRALTALARDGLIRKRPGAGTFVSRANRDAPITGDFTDMLAQLRAMGRETSVRLLSFGYGPAPPAVAAALGLPAGAETQQAVRVRSLGGLPFSHLTTHVPAEIGRRFGADDLAGAAMLELLERSGVMADRAEQTISATLAGPETAAALGLEPGAPLIALTRVVYDRQGRGIEHLSALYRPDRHRFHMRLTRAGDSASRRWLAAPPGPPAPDNANADASGVTRRRRKP